MFLWSFGVKQILLHLTPSFYHCLYLLNNQKLNTVFVFEIKV